MKMYKKPMTEVMDLKTASLMQGITVSLGGNNGDTSSPPPVQMPRRGEVIP